MRLLWFNFGFAQSGGGERLALEAAGALRPHGIDVVYVAYQYVPELVFGGRYDPSIEVMHKGGDPGRLPLLPRLRWLRKTVRRLRPHALVTSGTWGQVIDLYLATLGMGLPYAVHVYGSLFAFPPEIESTKYAFVFRHAFRRIMEERPSYGAVVPHSVPAMGFRQRITMEVRAWLKWRAIRAARDVLVLSEKNRWETELLYGVKARVLRGAFPRAALEYDSERDALAAFRRRGRACLLSVSRLAANKRVDLLLRATERAIRLGCDVQLLIGGTGPDEDALRDLAAKLGLGDRVAFLGHVDDADLWDYLAASDLFVSLDLADFDIAPLEALALGTRVLWTDDMEIPDSLLGCARLFVAKASVESVAQAIHTAVGATPDNGRASGCGLRELTWEQYFPASVERLVVPRPE